MPLYEVVILELPTEAEAEDGKLERLVLGPKMVIATEPQNAVVTVAMEDGAGLKVDKSRMQVLVRPFE